MTRQYTSQRKKSRSMEYDNKTAVKALLNWYDKHRRSMPWRAKPGTVTPPYKVWLSEIMLQQTTVQAVGPYFEKFVKRWPRIEDLAKATQEDVLKEWAGLGYYARGRNLHKCAQVIVHDYRGQFPNTVEELMKLPGVGPYTAGAIAAIAFNKPYAAVDGNVERVLSRLYAIKTPLPELKKEIWPHAQAIVEADVKRPSDTVQALMDLGATVCTPKSPRCSVCPWVQNCRAKKENIETTLPTKRTKQKIPVKRGCVFLVQHPKGNVLLERRGQKGLLAGMVGLPTTDWRAQKPDMKAQWPDFLAVSGQKSAQLVGQVRHTFTHFDLTLDVIIVPSKFLKKIYPENLYWSEGRLPDIEGLPRVFEKAIRLQGKK